MAKELAQVSSTFDQAKKDHQAHTEASRRDLLAHIQKEKEDNEKEKTDLEAKFEAQLKA